MKRKSGFSITFMFILFLLVISGNVVFAWVLFAIDFLIDMFSD